MFKNKTIITAISIMLILLIANGVSAVNETNETIMISPTDSTDHSQSPSISNDGNWITYDSSSSNIVEGDVNGKSDIFLYNVVKNITHIITPLNSDANSYNPIISGDGKWITYQSRATNIIENENKVNANIFLYEISTGITKLVTPQKYEW